MGSLSYVALKPLPVQMPDGERLTLEPGDLIPEEIHGRWLWLAQESGKVAASTDTEAATTTARKPRRKAAADA